MHLVGGVTRSLDSVVQQRISGSQLMRDSFGVLPAELAQLSKVRLVVGRWIADLKD